MPLPTWNPAAWLEKKNNNPRGIHYARLPRVEAWENTDCLLLGKELMGSGYNPAVLNFSSQDLACGADGNIPADIASLFKTVSEEPEFKDKYRAIAFACAAKPSTRSELGRFAPFGEIFGTEKPY